MVLGCVVGAQALAAPPPAGFVGELHPPPALAFVRRAAVVTPMRAGNEPTRVARWERVPVVDLVHGRVVTPDGWLPRDAVRLAVARRRPAAIPADAQWLHVDLREQVLTAYEGDELVYATLVAAELRPGITRVDPRTQLRLTAGDAEWLRGWAPSLVWLQVERAPAIRIPLPHGGEGGLW